MKLFTFVILGLTSLIPFHEVSATDLNVTHSQGAVYYESKFQVSHSKGDLVAIARFSESQQEFSTNALSVQYVDIGVGWGIEKKHLAIGFQFLDADLSKDTGEDQRNFFIEGAIPDFEGFSVKARLTGYGQPSGTESDYATSSSPFVSNSMMSFSFQVRKDQMLTTNFLAHFQVNGIKNEGSSITPLIGLRYNASQQFSVESSVGYTLATEDDADYGALNISLLYRL